MPATGDVAQDRKDLQRLCRTIREGEGWHWKAICAACELCRRGLWALNGAKSATEFFEKEFGYEKSYVSRLKKTGLITPILEKLPSGQQPTAERQVRPLIKLLKEPEKLAEAWQKACVAAGGKVPSAALVESEVDKLLPEKMFPHVESGSTTVPDSELISEGQEAFDAGYRLLLGKFDEVERQDVVVVLYALSLRDVQPSFLGKIAKAWASFHSRFTPMQWKKISETLVETLEPLLDDDEEDTSSESNHQITASRTSNQLEFSFTGELEGPKKSAPEIILSDGNLIAGASLDRSSGRGVRSRVPRSNDTKKISPAVTITR